MQLDTADWSSRDTRPTLKGGYQSKIRFSGEFNKLTIWSVAGGIDQGDSRRSLDRGLRQGTSNPRQNDHGR